MKLQLALDFITVEDAKALAEELGQYVDIIECGTPFIVKEGIRAVSEVKSKTDALILADMKIIDAGEYESKTAYEAGADIVTVLGVAGDATIASVVKEASRHGKYVMADMICVKDVEKRAAEIDTLGVDYICVHTAFDIQSTGKNPLDELILVSKVVKNAKTAIAGGVKLETLGEVVKYQPEIVIVGSGITGQADKRQAALDMKKMLQHTQ